MLLSIGKENLYVWEKRPGILHEDEAAALLYKAAAGRNIHGTEPKEGKIELVADCDGLLKIDRAALLADDPITAEDIARLGEGGLCLGCAECHWPNCGFGHC